MQHTHLFGTQLLIWLRETQAQLQRPTQAQAMHTGVELSVHALSAVLLAGELHAVTLDRELRELHVELCLRTAEHAQCGAGHCLEEHVEAWLC